MVYFDHCVRNLPWHYWLRWIYHEGQAKESYMYDKSKEGELGFIFFLPTQKRVGPSLHFTGRCVLSSS